jgi:predicted transcriptional regulator
MPAASIKDEAHRLVDQLSEDATWDDLMYEIYVRQAIERGLADSAAGRTTPVEEVQSRYGLQP